MFKPLDLQISVPRSIDSQRFQQIQNGRSVIDHQEYSRDAIKQSQQHQEQVQQNDASDEGNRIHDDAYNDSKNRERRYRRFASGKKRESEEDTAKQAIDNKRGQHIDIKI